MSERRLTDYTTCDVTVERVERGGIGRVYTGPDHRFLQGKWSALKTLHPRLLATECGHRLFLNECLTWVGLWPHPNLLTAHAVTEINSQLFLVLDYAEEVSLRDFLSRAADMTHGQPLPLACELEAAQHIAAGLLVLHTPDPAFLRPQPIVHRDLKPENILVLQGFAQITDFGLARVISDLEMTGETTVELEDESGADNNTDDTSATRSRRYRTQRGVAMGTFPYMPPEQWVDAATVGPPADLYAFGIILGELVMGNHPLLPCEQSRYAGEDQWQMIHLQARPPALAAARAQARYVAGAAHMAEPPLPAELDTLFQRLLAKHADERPTAAETFAALRRIATALGEEPYTPPEICPHTPENDYHRWHGWATSYEGFELYDEALACNDRALAPNTADVLLTRGNILAQLGRLDEALGFYDRALRSYTATDTDHHASVWNSQGNVLSFARRFPEPEAAYTQALRLNAGSPTTWTNRAHNEGQWARMSGVWAASRGGAALAPGAALHRGSHSHQPQRPHHHRVARGAAPAIPAVAHPRSQIPDPRDGRCTIMTSLNTRIARLGVERKSLLDGSFEYIFTIPSGVYRDRQDIESRGRLESNYLNAATLLRASADGLDPTDGEYQLSTLGEDLAQRHIPHEVREYLFAERTPLVIETNDPEFPWELLHYHGKFLGASRLVGRLAPLRQRVSPGIERWGLQRHALLIGNPEDDLPSTSEEITELKAWLTDYRTPYAVETLEGGVASLSRLSPRLQRGCEFLHFAGHVTYDESHHGASGLRCADGELLDADTIRGLRGDFAFVFINGCWGGRAALTDAEAVFSFQQTGPRVDGLAAAFIEAGASAFISALWPVANKSAKEFARAFYQQALTGVSFGEALRWTREKWQTKRPGDPSWASYVLYGNPLLTLDAVRDPSQLNDQLEQVISDARVRIPSIGDSEDQRPRQRNGRDRVERFFRRFVRDENIQLDQSGYDVLFQTLFWIDSQDWPTVARLDLLVGLAYVPESLIPQGLRALGSSPAQLCEINKRVFGSGRRTADQPNVSDGALSVLQRAARQAEQRTPARVTAKDIAEGLLDLPTTGSLQLGLQRIGCDGRMLLAAARGEPRLTAQPPHGQGVHSMALSQSDEIGHKRDATPRTLLVNLRAEAERAIRGSGAPPFVDRGPELREALTILSRNDHHHLLIHGPAGVGRGSLVAHIAITQVTDPHAAEIANVANWDLLAVRVGHDSPRIGERLRKELSELSGSAIIVMEDLPSLLQYPGVPEVLRDILRYATLRFVATATSEGYLQLFTHYASLAQLLVPLELKPPRPERAALMAQAHVQRLERRYRVTIAPDAAAAAVAVAHEEQPPTLPGAAIIRLERACVRAFGQRAITDADAPAGLTTARDGFGADAGARASVVTGENVRRAALTPPDEAEGGDHGHE